MLAVCGLTKHFTVRKGFPRPITTTVRAVDGISLTVAAVAKKSFRVWVIPHTVEATALRERKVGDAVNLETDLLGKYVERFLTTSA